MFDAQTHETGSDGKSTPSREKREPETESETESDGVEEYGRII